MNIKTAKNDLKKISNFKKYLKEALTIFYREDFFLIENGVHEQAISGKFAMILYDILKHNYSDTIPLSLDIEYNKHFENGKDIRMILSYIKDKNYLRNQDIMKKTICDVLSGHVSFIRPDIILHERKKNDSTCKGSSDNNVFVIEIKFLHTKKLKKSQDKKYRYDYAKLLALTCSPSAGNESSRFYNYSIGLHLGVHKDGVVAIFFQNAFLVQECIWKWSKFDQTSS